MQRAQCTGGMNVTNMWEVYSDEAVAECSAVTCAHPPCLPWLNQTASYSITTLDQEDGGSGLLVEWLLIISRVGGMRPDYSWLYFKGSLKPQAVQKQQPLKMCKCNLDADPKPSENWEGLRHQWHSVSKTCTK